MAYFPFFMDLEGQKGLIVGGGRIAAHKIQKLLPFGAFLTVVAPVIETALLDNPELHCLEREFADSDVEGMMFVIAASDDGGLNAHISELCKERGVLVNVVDDKEKCGFLFPSLVKEGKLVVGISTEGASPQIAASLRSRIAEELPGQMERILDYLNGLRILAKEQIENDRKRASFLKETALFCLEQNRPLTEEETRDRLGLYTKQANSAGREAEKYGSVTLVGAGCGSYDLITVKGLNAVRSAQVLVYDDLMDSRLLDHAPESCERLYVGKRSGAHSMKQEEINALLIQKAKEGKRVVRLKGGDPFVFGRGGEEMLALGAEGIAMTEIPGITSSIGVPAAAGIPVTHRGISRSFHVITGHTADSEDGLPENIEVLARLEGTCIYLMGFRHLEQIAQKLIQYGKSADTPVAVVHGNFDGSTLAVRGTLENISDRVKKSKIEMPAVIVIGGTAEIDIT